MKAQTMAGCALLFSAFAIPVSAFAGSGNLESLLGTANQMNNEEQDMAKELKSKAGDNQALITLADTLRDDHKANQSAVEALANQKNISLKSYEKNRAAEDRLDNLNGSQFNEAFLKVETRDHEKALATFREAKTEFGNDPNVRVYIDQTIPVLEAHLKMAENLQHDDKAFQSRENTANNKN